jgi:hypothetical protein
MANAKQIDPKLLAGLTFRTSKVRKGKPGEDDATMHDRVERDLTPDDVLDWADNGATVTVVTADGQKYRIDKKAASAAAKSAGDDAK